MSISSQMKSTLLQATALIVAGAAIGWAARTVGTPDFDAALQPPKEASADEISSALKGQPGAIPIPRMIAYLDLRSQLYGQANVTLVDARDQGTFEAGHIPGAIHVDAEGLDGNPFAGKDVLAAVPKSQILVVYCSGGDCDLSLRLARNLIVRGYTTVFVFEGGWDAWTSEGDEVEEGPAQGEQG